MPLHYEVVAEEDKHIDLVFRDHSADLGITSERAAKQFRYFRALVSKFFSECLFDEPSGCAGTEKSAGFQGSCIETDPADQFCLPGIVGYECNVTYHIRVIQNRNNYTKNIGFLCIFAPSKPEIMTKEQKAGHISMLAASIMWGLMSPVSKAAMNSDAVSSLLVADVRIFGAAVLFWIISLFLPGEKVEDKGDYVKLFFAGLFAILLNQCVFVTGVSMTSPVDASIITTTLPIVTMIFAAIFIKEPITGLKAGGVLLGACGALLLVFGNRLLPGASDQISSAARSSNLSGDLLCFFAQCSYAIYLVIFRDLIKKYSPVTLMKWMFTFASIVLLPVSARSLALTGWDSITLTEYAELAYVLVFGTFLCYLIVPVGQKYLRPTLVAMYNYVQPVVATVVAIIWGMDSFNILKILAVILIFGGVFLVNKSKARNAEDNA